MKHVVAAWAEPASGPGWANQPIRYITQDDNGKLEMEWLQPQEHTDGMAILYGVSSVISGQMRQLVSNYLQSKEVTHE